MSDRVLLLKWNNASVSEVFNIPGSYPEFETESGQRLDHGWYHWLLNDQGTPDTYPTGPFPTRGEAVEDAEIGAAYEPDDDEE